jgi:succinate dehydrogenase/fumarate reductase flavoprotein subunit
VTTSAAATIPAGLDIADTTVDLLVIGSGTGLAAALSGQESGLGVLVVEKASDVGGSTARSGGALWLPTTPLLTDNGTADTADRASTYLDAVVNGSAPAARSTGFLEHVNATVDMLGRTTPMRLFWARGYSDYHPELPGGRATGRTCECRPLNARVLGKYRDRLRGGIMEVKVPMPTTGADYKWMNLMTRVPRKGLPLIAKRLAQGIGGKLLGREYIAGGQALAAGLFAGVLQAGIPIWTDTSLVRLTGDGQRVTGAVLAHAGREVTVAATRGVVLAAGGFDHDMAMRHKYQSESLGEHESLGADSNTGAAIRAATDLGAATALMDQAWWFPAVASANGRPPAVLLADYMSFGQRVLELERAGTPVESMWIVFDQKYRNSYVFAAGSFPRMPLPKSWYQAGIAAKATDFTDLAAQMGVPVADFERTMTRFNESAAAGIDPDFDRGLSAYDRYYGDPTVTPNPNLRPLAKGPFYAVKMTLSDLGTCGGLVADERGRVHREDGGVIEGLYALGNTAANAFGAVYPGAGATIAQGLVYGYIAGRDAAGKL